MNDMFKSALRISLAAVTFAFASQAYQASAQFNQTVAFTITDAAGAKLASPGCPKKSSISQFVRGTLPETDYKCYTNEEDVRGVAAYYAPYAIQAALSYYQITNDATLASQIEAVFPNQSDKVNGVLAQKGWRFRFPDRCVLLDQCTDYNIDPGGLAYHVWSRADRSGSCREATVAFRGSVLSLQSWFSNLEQQLPGFETEYVRLNREFNSVLKVISEKLHCTHIVTLGHSLGGGLAQFVALGTSPRRQIAKVVTFNTSPVSGVNLISDQELLSDNATGLTIDRVNQQGEILSLPFFTRRRQTRSSLCDPLVRGVEFNESSGRSWTPFVSALNEHSMVPLASKLVGLSYSGTDPNTGRPRLVAAKLPPAGRQSCTPRYQEEQEIIAGVRPNETRLYASASRDFIGAQLDQGGPMYSYAADRNSLSGKLIKLKLSKRVMLKSAHRANRVRAVRS